MRVAAEVSKPSLYNATMMTANSQVVPILAPNKKKTPWGWWVALWVMVAVCEVVLLTNNGALDTQLFRITRWFAGQVDSTPYRWAQYEAAHQNDPARPFYVRVKPPMNGEFYHRYDRLWNVFKAFGEVWMVGILLWVVALYDRRHWRAALAGLAAVGLAGGGTWLLAAADGRLRPTNTDGANLWQFMRGFKNSGDLSFPSGHATVVFTMAAVLTYLSPRGRWVFVTVATGCAVSRVVTQAHFWSDVIFGGSMGWTVGWVVMVLGDRVGVQWEQRQRIRTG